MPSHLSTLGFDVQTQEDLVALVQQVVSVAEAIPARAGQYLKWVGGSGEELWLQADESGNLVGLNPHFTGKSLVRVRLEELVRREDDTVWDGAFKGWAEPEENKPESGAYPFAFDSPDAATYADLVLPVIADVQIAAFAHEIAANESPEAYDASQKGQEVRFASRSFIPSGLFRPDGTATTPAGAMAFFTGHVIEAGVRRNLLSGRPFFWALVDTFGGRYDVVIDRSLLPHAPSAGGVLSGSFWLSGRLISFPKRRSS
jgi:hypothetical protein